LNEYENNLISSVWNTRPIFYSSNYLLIYVLPDEWSLEVGHAILKQKTDTTVIAKRQIAEHCLHGEHEHTVSPSLKHKLNPHNG
jgi:hypothetical protein